MASLQDLSLIVPADVLHAAGVPSASIAVLSEGNVETHVIAKGSEDTETIYQACSISKPITGLAVARLIDQGKLTYNTLISDHLPARILDLITTDKTQHLLAAVTVGHLVSHTSGLSQGGFPGYDCKVPTVEQILSGTAPANTIQIHFNTFPGAQYAYSGGGWTVLQLFLEHLLSKPFPEFMQELVLGPLHMTRSHYGPLPGGERNFAKAHNTAEVEANAPYHELPEMAAAGLWTTPVDLLKAVSALQHSIVSSDGFLTRATAQLLLTPVRNASPAMGDIARGFFVTDSSFGHGGSNDPGYRTYFLGSRAADGEHALPPAVGIAVMTNSVLGWDEFRKIVAAVSYMKQWPWQKSLASYGSTEGYVPYTVPERMRHVSDGQQWKPWVGTWEGGWTIGGAEGDVWPTLAYGNFQNMPLLPGAGPVRSLAAGTEVLLVVEGLDISLRLTWDDEGERIVKILQIGVMSDLRTLRRSAS